MTFTSDKEVRSGRLVIKGTGFTLSQLLAEIAEHDLLKNICEDFSLPLEETKDGLHQLAVMFDEPSDQEI